MLTSKLKKRFIIVLAFCALWFTITVYIYLWLNDWLKILYRQIIWFSTRTRSSLTGARCWDHARSSQWEGTGPCQTFYCQIRWQSSRKESNGIQEIAIRKLKSGISANVYLNIYDTVTIVDGSAERLFNYVVYNGNEIRFCTFFPFLKAIINIRTKYFELQVGYEGFKNNLRINNKTEYSLSQSVL